MNTKIFKPAKNKLAQAVALGILAFAANQSQATDYTFSDLGTVSGPYAGMTVSGINNPGQVIGGDGVTPYVWTGDVASPLDTQPDMDLTSGAAINDLGQTAGSNYSIAQDRGYPIRWNGSSATVVDTLGGGFISAALAINNSGQMVGASWFGSSFHPVRWDGNTITELDTLGGSAGVGGGINDAGIVVGQSRITNDDANHATLWIGAAATDLGTLGGTGSTANDINNKDQIVGWGNDINDISDHAILWNGLNATPQDLGTLGGDYSAAQAINDFSQIVGSSTLVDGSTHAVLWDTTSNLIDLNAYLPAELSTAGWVMTYGFGINNSGVIVGYLSNTADTSLAAAFKLTPTTVPVPGAVWLFGSALAGFMGMKRRKQ